MAENQIEAMKFNNFYTFRPGYIYPVQAREEPNVMYKISRTLYPVIKLFIDNIKSIDLANAMVNVGLKGANKSILENKDILNYL